MQRLKIYACERTAERENAIDTTIHVNTINRMRIDFDPAKDAANKAKHGLSLALAAELKVTHYAEND